MKMHNGTLKNMACVLFDLINAMCTVQQLSTASTYLTSMFENAERMGTTFFSRTKMQNILHGECAFFMFKQLSFPK